MKSYFLALFFTYVLLEGIYDMRIALSAGVMPEAVQTSQFESAFAGRSIRYNRFPRKRRRFPAWGTPAWSSGGAVRGCSPNELPVIPLMPVMTEMNGVSLKTPTFFGTTTKRHPEFFAYVPPADGQTLNRVIEFSLGKMKSADPKHDKVIYTRKINVSGGSQILRFTVPSNEQPLNPNFNYRWMFKTVCPPPPPGQVATRSNGSSPYIEGYVQRETISSDTDLGQALQKTTQPIQQAEIYASNGIWLDSLSTLANLHCQNPKNAEATAQWKEMLEAIELDKIPELENQVSTEEILKAQLVCSK